MHDFAVPGRKYPIPDRSHARNALARVSQHGTPTEKAEVRKKVKSKYPGIHQASGGDKVTLGDLVMQHQKDRAKQMRRMK